MKTEDYISRTAFFGKYHTMSAVLYGQFCAKVSDELEAVLDKGITIESMGFRSCWTDAGNNIHCSLDGHVRRLDESGEIRGEIVMLRTSKTFRGWAKHDLKRIEDWEYVQSAREQFKQRNYTNCLQLLSLLRNRELLTPANLRMEAIAKSRTSSKSMSQSR